MITARSLGVYLYMVAKGAPTSSSDLAKAFGGDRKTYLKDLKVLKEAGLAHSRIQVVNGRPITVTSLTDESPLNGLQILLSQLNSNLNLNTYSFISKKEYIRDRMETPTMSDYEPSPSYVEPEDRAEYIRKQRAKRDAEYRDMREQQFQANAQARKTRTPELWSTDDSANYFAEKVAGMWHVKPWIQVRTRFKAAYGKSRKTYGTTGDIELKMMDRFLSTIEHNKTIDDPEAIWKSFIKQYGSLAVEVMNSEVTEIDIEEANKIADKQWGDLDV